jgi:pimeloyl-ACP methyl ester carboxylesterase
MENVTSPDGTELACERAGEGPAVVLVGGGAVDRSENAPLVPLLADRFSVVNYDRRGRGDSGDTAPYAREREIEDLAAVIDAAGGRAHVYGISSGGALALEAAAAGLAIERVAVYEVPYFVDESAAHGWRDYRRALAEALAEGRRGDAFALFMRIAGATDDMVEGARQSPAWPGCEAIAPTLAYDAACIGDGPPPTERLARVAVPTLVATGGASPDSFVGGGGSFFDDAADTIAAAVPGAERAIVPGQTHEVDAATLAPVLTRFFAG